MVRATLRVMSMAERVARKACLFAPLASRYIAKKIEAIEPKRVPTAPEKKLASGRSTAGGTGGALPGGRVDIHRELISNGMVKAERYTLSLADALPINAMYLDA